MKILLFKFIKKVFINFNYLEDYDGKLYNLINNDLSWISFNESKDSIDFIYENNLFYYKNNRIYNNYLNYILYKVSLFSSYLVSNKLLK